MRFAEEFGRTVGIDVPGRRVKITAMLDPDLLGEIDAAVGEERSSRGAVIRRVLARWTRERQGAREAA